MICLRKLKILPLRKWKKCKTKQNWDQYRSHCEILTKALNECKTQFFSTKVIESENEKKKLFSVAKSLLGNFKNLLFQTWAQMTTLPTALMTIL